MTHAKPKSHVGALLKRNEKRTAIMSGYFARGRKAMPFLRPDERAPKEIFPGVTIRTLWGEQVMLSFVHFEPFAVVPPHSHPHEQMGVLLEGELEFTIGDETRVLRKGDCWWVPSGVVHSVRNRDKPALALDIFHPIREEYK
jgi:quercetin dioxygenase-like cupin family protein